MEILWQAGLAAIGVAVIDVQMYGEAWFAGAPDGEMSEAGTYMAEALLN